jgi:site-specific recombinase XerD
MTEHRFLVYHADCHDGPVRRLGVLLRHSTASLLLAEGVHPKIVQELLGHSQISVTMDVYGHLMPGQREQAVDALARARAT